MTAIAPKPLTNDQIVNLAPAAGSLAPIHGVSDKYSFVPTLDAVNLLREIGWFPVTAEQAGVRNPERAGFQKHLIRFAKDGLAFDGERVDMVLYNSHDRECAFKLAASVWRYICGNGLMVASEFANFSHRHIGFSPDDFVQSASKIAGSAGEIAGRVEDLKIIELSPVERGLYAQAAHSLICDNVEEAPIKSTQLLEERRYDDKGKDLWSTYNLCQENIMKGGLKGHTRNQFGRIRRTTTRPVKAIDKNVKLNQALWTLTEKMAELKGH